MVINFRQLNPHSCWTYLIEREGSDEVLIVDPVLDHFNDYVKLLEEEKLKLTYLIDTHTHADHISGAAALKDVTGCEYMMHEKAPSQCVTIRVKDGSKFQFWSKSDISVKILHTPGHTQDGICLVFPDFILTGDTLFLDDGGAGRDDLPGGDPNSHWESLQRLMELSNNLIVYPAHEYRNRQPSTLGEQKKRNPHLIPRTKEEFVTFIEDLKLGPADWMKDVLKANYACARDPKAAWIPADVPACEVKGTLDTNVNRQQVIPISPKQLKLKLDSSKPQLLLDVREAAELKGDLGHLPGIKHIPVWQLSSKLSELEEYKEREIITICRSGARASTAAQILQQAGFEHVNVLDGGMINWRAEFGK